MHCAASLAKQLTERDVTAVAGVSLYMLYQLESGSGTVDIDTLLAVCESVGMVLLLAPKAVAKKVLTVPASPPAGETFLQRLIREKDKAAAEPNKANENEPDPD